MKTKQSSLARRYASALKTHLRQGHRAGLESARGLGSQALAGGLGAMDLAKLNEQILALALLPECSARKRAELIKQAGIFFAMAITPIEKTRRTERDATAHLEEIVLALSQRTVELSASNQELSLEIAQRKVVETALRKSERHSIELQEQLRRLSRKIISAQEDERKRISRELHDVIAQTLTGINLRLAALKKAAQKNHENLDEKIASAQLLVEKSVEVVHRFALELRPAVLDDLGLIPALLSFMQNFMQETGVRARLTAFAGVEQWDMDRRTVLFRVAQESLANVAEHAQASLVEVSIQQTPDGICMKIADNGKSFLAQRALATKGSKRLGLLGMRERLEMVGGRFEIESTPGVGTTIIARISHPPAAKPKPKKL